MAHLNRLLPTVIDRVWDAALAAQKPIPSNVAIDSQGNGVSENSRLALLADAVSTAASNHVRKRPRQSKLRQGEARDAILKVIKMFPEEGISRAGIKTKVRPLLGGNEISPNTLKRALMDLRGANAIYTKNSAWYPAGADDQK